MQHIETHPNITNSFKLPWNLSCLNPCCRTSWKWYDHRSMWKAEDHHRHLNSRSWYLNFSTQTVYLTTTTMTDFSPMNWKSSFPWTDRDLPLVLVHRFSASEMSWQQACSSSSCPSSWSQDRSYPALLEKEKETALTASKASHRPRGRTPLRLTWPWRKSSNKKTWSSWQLLQDKKTVTPPRRSPKKWE